MKIVLPVVLVLVTGCTATLQHPRTGHKVVCSSGATVATGPAALIVAPIANAVGGIGYRSCVKRAEKAGYVEVAPPEAQPVAVEPPTDPNYTTPAR